MTRSLVGRRALVTGGSGGIGAAISLSLADAGADVVLTYSGHRDEAEATAVRVRELGRTATVLQADLRLPRAGRTLVAEAEAAAGPIDVLIANAGVGAQVPWDEVDDELWDETFAVNVTAPWQLTQAVLAGMVERGFGRILYVSSIAALMGGIVGPHYGASKSALHGLMHHVAARVAGSGVTVNTIAPALISGTRLLPRAPEGSSLPIPIPVGHLGEPEDVASMALEMVTNRYLTNKVISVDGGIYPD